jgi:putative DNA methylase
LTPDTLLAAISLHPARADRFWDRFYGKIDLSGLVVLDPFVGGGTSLIEAEQCGARVVGYDIDPIAAAIARFGLELDSFSDLPASAERIVSLVREKVSRYHVTTDGAGRSFEILHHFWVERRSCSECGEDFDLHPHHQLAYDAAKGIQWAFCRACHEVHEFPLGRKQIRCGCGERTPIHSGPLVDGAVRCPSCGASEALSARGRRDGTPPKWRLFAQEYLEPEGSRVLRRFKRATEADQARYDAAARALSLAERKGERFAPSRHIPQEGRSDGRPLIHGFTRYRELFNRRQLLHLTLLGRSVAAVEDPRERLLLGMAFSDHLTSNCMYAAYAFGYRRLSPLFSIHSYRHITRPVELNPWLDGIGRGTFPNALNKMRRAIQFSRAPSYLGPDGGRDWEAVRVPRAAQGASPVRDRASIRAASSADLSTLGDASVDLILTDPPYFDNISYSELSDFYLCWHQALGIAEPPYDDPSRPAPLRENLALANRSDGAVETYGRTLAAILRECRRVLRADGLCVFTYHHNSPRAWSALARAVVHSGFRVTAVVPSRGEGQGGLHSYEGTIKWDAVLVCRPSAIRPLAEEEGMPLVVSTSDMKDAEAKTAVFSRRLAREEKIGFRAPDRVNLYRAMIVAKARLAGSGGSVVLLDEALRSGSPMKEGRADA